MCLAMFGGWQNACKSSLQTNCLIFVATVFAHAIPLDWQYGGAKNDAEERAAHFPDPNRKEKASNAKNAAD